MIRSRAVAPVIAFCLLPWGASLAAQDAVLVVKAQTVPSLEAFRALDEAPGGVVSVRIAEDTASYPCRLVLRGGVLCRVPRFPRSAPDLQLRIDAPGHREETRTAEVRVEGNQLAVEAGTIHLHPAEVTAAPVASSSDGAGQRFELSVTNRSPAQPVDVRQITLEALRPTGRCTVEEPVPVYRISATLRVRERSAGRWAVEAASTNPHRPGERLRVSGELVADRCYRDRLVLHLRPRISIPAGRQLSLDLLLPERFTVEGQTRTGATAGPPGEAGPGGGSFDGSVGRFTLWVITLETSSPAAPVVRTFVQR